VRCHGITLHAAYIAFPLPRKPEFYRHKGPKFSREDAISVVISTKHARKLKDAEFLIDRLVHLGVIQESKGTTKRRKTAAAQEARGQKHGGRPPHVMYRFKKDVINALKHQIEDHKAAGRRTSRRLSVDLDGAAKAAQANARNDVKGVSLSPLAQIASVAGLVSTTWVGWQFHCAGAGSFGMAFPLGITLHFRYQEVFEVVFLSAIVLAWSYFFGDTNIYETKTVTITRSSSQVYNGLERQPSAGVRSVKKRYTEMVESRVAKVDMSRYASLDAALDAVHEFMAKEQILDAGDLLHAVERRLLEEADSDELILFKGRLQRDLVNIGKIHKKYENAVVALVEFRYGEEAGWEPAGTVHGNEVFSKKDKRGDIWVKVDGFVVGDAAHCLAVWREGDLYQDWFPSVDFSGWVAEVGKAEVCMYFGGTFIPRLVGQDTVVHGYGVENLRDGYFLILGESVDNWPVGTNQPLPVPEPPASFFRRLFVNALKIYIEPLPDGTVRNSMIVSLRLDFPFPAWLVTHAFKAVFGMIYVSMQATMDKMKAEDAESSHYRRFAQSTSVYRDWLLPLFDQYLRQVVASRPATLLSQQSSLTEDGLDALSKDGGGDARSREQFSDTASETSAVTTMSSTSAASSSKAYSPVIRHAMANQPPKELDSDNEDQIAFHHPASPARAPAVTPPRTPQQQTSSLNPRRGDKSQRSLPSTPKLGLARSRRKGPSFSAPRPRSSSHR